MKYINAGKLIAEIERRKELLENGTGCPEVMKRVEGVLKGYNSILDFIKSLQQEQQEVELDNNGWINCRKQMPKETKQWSDTLQGHREWTESDKVLVWDSMYGCGVDATKNGKWMSEQRRGCTGQIVHGIIAWRPIPEFNEELFVKTQERRTE